MRFAAAIGVGVLVLGGCSSVDGTQPPSPQQAARDDATCRSYGTYPGTTPYVQCRLGLRRIAQQRADEASPLQTLFGN